MLLYNCSEGTIIIIGMPSCDGREENVKMKTEIDMNMDMVLISIYNAQNDTDNKIYVNDADFFENSFDNSYDAAWAVSLSGRWSWTDEFVYFNDEGYITSFSHWDDERSPINLDKLDICQLINSLKRWHKKRYVVNDIPRAIHEALE